MSALNTLAPLSDLSPSGPLESVYPYLTPKEARQLSATCRAARRVFINEEVQKAFLNIHFPKMANGFSVSSRGLFLRASVGRNTKAEAILTLSGHTSEVRCLQMSEDKTKALSGSCDNTLKLWDLTTGACLRTLTGHRERVTCLQMSADETIALSGSWDTTLKLWNLITGECLRTLLGHRDRIKCLEISADGTKALSGSLDRTLKFWDLTTGTCLLTLLGHTNPVISLQMSADGTRALSGSWDHTLKFWDLTTGTCLQTLVGHEYWITCLRMSADGRKALSGSADNTLKLWDLATGICLRTFSGHKYWINCLQVSTDGTKVLSGSCDHTIKLWDLTTGACLQTLTGDGNVIKCLQMSADGKRALSGFWNKTLKFWDLTTGASLQVFPGHESWINCLQMSRDGTKALSGCADKNLKLWNLIPPHPEERVARVARTFFENREEAGRLFLELPRFVQDRITRALFELHVRKAKVSPNQTDPNYGKKAFLGEEGFSSLAEERNEVFANYMKRQFLPDVAEYLEECERQNIPSRVAYTQSTLFKEALECLDQLPISIKNDVYKALYEIKKTAETLPERAPRNYGDLAFHEKKNYTATIQERVQAIKNVMAY